MPPGDASSEELCFRVFNLNGKWLVPSGQSYTEDTGADLNRIVVGELMGLDGFAIDIRAIFVGYIDEDIARAALRDRGMT